MTLARLAALLLTLLALNVQAADCRYPRKPINWIMRYCAMKVQTDDEVVIQDSACYKSAINDAAAADPCAMNKKYKTKICEEFMMEAKRLTSLKQCLADDEVTPYVSG